MYSFCRPVDKRSRADMIAYLSGHFRYDTMRSWNGSTSYAHNMKIYNLGLDRDIADKLYSMIQVDAFHESLNELMCAFSEEHNYYWQAGMNGRSGGYLVLYQGAREPSGYKSYCASCGQLNYKSTSESGKVCGVCHEPKREDFPHTHMRVVTYAGRSTDADEDFEDWSMYQLRERIELVQDFGRLADSLVSEAVYFANNYDIYEESYYVEKNRLALLPVR